MFVPLQVLYEITVWIACIGTGGIRNTLVAPPRLPSRQGAPRESKNALYIRRIRRKLRL